MTLYVAEIDQVGVWQIFRGVTDFPLIRAATEVIENALDHGKSTTRRPEIEIVRESNLVIVVVRDFGCGIKPEDMDKVMRVGDMDPFYTTSDDDSNTFRLGLKEALDIILTEGGSVTMESHGISYRAIKIHGRPAFNGDEVSDVVVGARFELRISFADDMKASKFVSDMDTVAQTRYMLYAGRLIWNGEPLQDIRDELKDLSRRVESGRFGPHELTVFQLNDPKRNGITGLIATKGAIALLVSKLGETYAAIIVARDEPGLVYGTGKDGWQETDFLKALVQYVEDIKTRMEKERRQEEAQKLTKYEEAFSQELSRLARSESVKPSGGDVDGGDDGGDGGGDGGNGTPKPPRKRKGMDTTPKELDGRRLGEVDVPRHGRIHGIHPDPLHPMLQAYFQNKKSRGERVAYRDVMLQLLARAILRSEALKDTVDPPDPSLEDLELKLGELRRKMKKSFA